VTHLENVFLERYFLEPGGRGPVASVYVADEDLMEIMNVDTVEKADSAFTRYLPRAEQFRDIITGKQTVILGNRLRYVGMLMFLCWIQTSATREPKERSIHQMLTRRFNVSFAGFSFFALNDMWRHLQSVLKRSHGVDLVLQMPKTGDIWVGCTRRISFPTWRDLEVLRSILHQVRPEFVLDPSAVARVKETASAFAAEERTSLDFNYRTFAHALRKGGREYRDTAFWHAWYNVVSKEQSFEHLEISEGDFGEYEMARVSPVGTKRMVTSPDAAAEFLTRGIREAIRKGVVILEAGKDGTLRAVVKGNPRFLLIHTSKLPLNGVRSHFAIDSRWSIASLADAKDAAVNQKPAPQEFGWHDGIRIGTSYLGRAPLTPLVSVPAGRDDPIVAVDGKRLAMEPTKEGYRLPNGVYSGRAEARHGVHSNAVHLIPRAVEFGEQALRFFDGYAHISDDLENFDTAPGCSAPIAEHDGPRQAACASIVTIGEALYARSARGLGFTEAFGIIRRGLPDEGGPHAWEVFRAFTDAGWFDSVINRSFPSRSLVQRRLSYTELADRRILVTGPLTLAVLERLRIAAEAAGVMVDVRDGISEWSLPRLIARTASDSARKDFIVRAKLAAVPPAAPATHIRGDQSGFHGYHVAKKLDMKKGYFEVHAGRTPADGVYRLERTEGRSPPIYVSSVPGLPDESFTSTPLAILADLCRRGRTPFVFDGRTLRGAAVRAALPASWARWLADRALSSPGPVREASGWSYAYPMGRAEASVIGMLVPVHDTSSHGGQRWIETSLSSSSHRGRTIFDSTTRTVRGLPVASGKP
jgi:hypothetical protein